LSEIGFFYIGDYEDAIPSSLVSKMRAHTDSLFGAKLEEKSAIHLSKSPHFRGWSALNEEVTLGVPDFKETFDFGYDETPLAPEEAQKCRGDHAWKNMRGPNQYLQSMRDTSFETDMRRYMDGLSRVGRVVMNSAALCLDREPVSLDRFFTDPFCLLRMIKYPPSADADPKVGIGSHSDYGFLTLIQQDPHVNGLQALSRAGQWVDVDPIPNTFAVNIGDMAEAWSSGVYRSTPHRVINSINCAGTDGNPNNGNNSRVSMAFFYEPALEATLDEHMLQLRHDGTDPVELYGQHLHRAYTRSYPTIGSA